VRNQNVTVSKHGTYATSLEEKAFQLRVLGVGDGKKTSGAVRSSASGRNISFVSISGE